jgi:hypothetical protein
MAEDSCPLCGHESSPFFADERGRYRRCATCALIHMHADDRLSPMAEVLRYLEHDNRRDDARYVAFLRRLGDWVEASTPAGAEGLDYGCGPVPVLGELLTESGRPTFSYDPLFHPNERLLRQRYDFVTCSEVAEHAHSPAALFEQLASLVRAGGKVGVMTRMYGAEAPFAQWWYRRDPTHVSFYSDETMRWIAGRFGWSLELPAAHVAIFTA